MVDLFSDIKRKSRAIWLVACLLLIYNMLRMLIIIASPYQLAEIASLDVASTFAEYSATFQAYLNNESARHKMSPNTLKLITLVYGSLAALYGILSVLLGMRKKIAKHLILCVIIMEILLDFAVGIQYAILPSKISIMLVIFLILFFQSPTISKELR